MDGKYRIISEFTILLTAGKPLVSAVCCHLPILLMARDSTIEMIKRIMIYYGIDHVINRWCYKQMSDAFASFFITTCK